MLLDVIDQAISAGIMSTNLVTTAKLWLYDLGQLFAQLNTSSRVINW